MYGDFCVLVVVVTVFVCLQICMYVRLIVLCVDECAAVTLARNSRVKQVNICALKASFRGYLPLYNNSS